MSLLYYRIRVFDRGNPSNEKILRKLSNLSTWSPLGTRLFIPAYDTRYDFYAEVVSYEHLNHYDPVAQVNVLGSLYMILSATKHEIRYFVEPETHFGVTSGDGAQFERPMRVWESLIEDGWEEVPP